MSLLYTMNALELLDSPSVSGESVKQALMAAGVPGEQISVKTVHGPKGSTDFVKTWFYGSEGKHNGGTAPTIGIVGRLGGIGARPERIGLVSDGDGAVSAVAVAMKLATWRKKATRSKATCSSPLTSAPILPPVLTIPCRSWVLPST